MNHLSRYKMSASTSNTHIDVVSHGTTMNHRNRRRSISISSIISKASNKANEVTTKIKQKLLYHYEELPDWQKDNELILTGYIRETNSYKLCVKSLTFLHNETINIYTHGLTAIFYAFLCLSLTKFIFLPEFPTTTIQDYLHFYIFLIGAVLCLTLSTGFHCLKQHSQSQSDLWSKMDYLGIIINISCSTISLLFFGYRDHLTVFRCFATLTVILALCCTIFVLDDKFNTKNYRHIRAYFFISFACSGFIPVITGMMNFGLNESLQRIQYRSLLLEIVFYASGALIYGYRIPEIFAPGKFDFFGSSHQLFHILVILGTYFHLRAIVGSYTFMHATILAAKKIKKI